MTRKLMRAVVVGFASLAMLPGCHHLASKNSVTNAETRFREELVAQKEAASRQPGQDVQERKADALGTESVPPDPQQQASRTTPELPETRPTSPDPPLDVLEPKLDLSKRKPLDVNLTGFTAGDPKSPVVPVLDKPGERQYAPFVKALQDLLDERQPEAIRHLEAYDKDTQEFMLRVLPILTIFAKKRFDELAPQDIAMINEQFLGVLARLRPRTELGINRMCFCKNVKGFGNVETLPENHAFLAGSQDRLGELMQVYVELKNFGSEPTAESGYLTKLACTLEVRDAVKGDVVWSHTYDRKATTHRRQTRINDFFSNFSFYVPPVAPGAYQLTVHIADESHPELRREVRKSLDFRVTPVTGQALLR